MDQPESHLTPAAKLAIESYVRRIAQRYAVGGAVLGGLIALVLGWVIDARASLNGRYFRPRDPVRA